MTVSTELHQAIADWRELLGQDAVLESEPATRRYGGCTTGAARRIVAAVIPDSAAAVAEIVRIANRHGTPLYPISTGHNWGYGSAQPSSGGATVLDLSGLNRILDMDREFGTVTLEPGVTQQQLYDYLEERGLPFMVPATGAGPTCSLVGNALERGYGLTPHADHFGAVTALEAVMADGRTYRGALSEMGGQAVDRLFKWGIGPYIDGLFAQGAFGIVTKITILLARRPAALEAILFTVRESVDVGQAAEAVQRVLRRLGDTAGSINLMNDRRMLAMIAPHPDPSARGVVDDGVVAKLRAVHRIARWNGAGALYGEPAMVRAARAIVRAELRPIASRLLFVSPGRARWLESWIRRVPGMRGGTLNRQIEKLRMTLSLLEGSPSRIALPLPYWLGGSETPTRDEPNPERDGCGLIWFAPLVPMARPKVLDFTRMIDEVCRRHGIEPLITLTSLSDRCFDSTIPILFRKADAAGATRAQACFAELFDAGRAMGCVPYRLGIHAMDRYTDGGGIAAELASTLKRSVDPGGIIAPGRYGALPS